jgi:ABC-2 type transport system ATP-binding protein/ribosome-dependent ATPase
MVLGLLRPSAGEVALFGAPPSTAARPRVGYQPPGLGLWGDLTVQENLAFATAAFGAPSPPLDDDLAAAGDRLVRDLPLGLRRRTAFAAALAHRPEVLILDEPTSGVDPLARAGLWETIRAAAEAGAGVLVTTHAMDESEQCDRLVVMANGRVVAEGTGTEVIGDTTAVEVRAQRWEAAFEALEAEREPVALRGRTLRVPAATPNHVAAVLARRGVAADLRVVPATLEEAFVALATRSPSESP